MERNIRLYTAYRFFWGLLIIGPALVPFMLAKGMSYTQIMILQSISSIAVVVFEMPNGAVADMISRKHSLFLSGLCIGLSLLLFILFSSFYIFAVAEILFGLGLTFGSGADSALLYESLKKLDRQSDYARIEGRSSFYVFMGQAVGSVASSLLYTLSPAWPYWCSVFSVLTAAVFALRLTEPEREKSKHAYHIHLTESLTQVRRSPVLLWAVLLALLVGFGFRTAIWLYEPYFTRVDIDIVWFGTIFFFYNIIAALAARYLTHRYTQERQVLLALALLLAVSYLLPAIIVSAWSVAIIGLQQIVRGVYKPTLNAYINRQVEDARRATVISTVSLAGSLSFALVAPLVGLSLDHYGAITTYMLVGTVITIGVIALQRRQTTG